MPSRAVIGALLAAAALVGFLSGALIATIQARPTPVAVPGPTVTVPVSPSPADPTPATIPTLTLAADRSTAAARELIRLTGQLTPPVGGVTLQVQQAVDPEGFRDFPVTDVTEPDGSYGMWVRTQRTGESQFRVVTEVNGQRVISAPVSVQIG